MIWLLLVVFLPCHQLLNLQQCELVVVGCLFPLSPAPQPPSLWLGCCWLCFVSSVTSSSISTNVNWLLLVVCFLCYQLLNLQQRWLGCSWLCFVSSVTSSSISNKVIWLLLVVFCFLCHQLLNLKQCEWVVVVCLQLLILHHFQSKDLKVMVGLWLSYHNLKKSNIWWAPLQTVLNNMRMMLLPHILNSPMYVKRMVHATSHMSMSMLSITQRSKAIALLGGSGCCCLPHISRFIYVSTQTEANNCIVRWLCLLSGSSSPSTSHICVCHVLLMRKVSHML